MSASDDYRHALRTILLELARGARFSDSDDVFELGVVRSLNLIELITWVEDRYGLEVTQRDVFEGNLRSVDRMVDFLVLRCGAT